MVRSLVGGAAVALVGAALLSPVPAAAQDAGPYPDTRSDAYYSVPVGALASDGVFGGTECDEGFCPDKPLDRTTMAVWTVRVLDGEDPAPVAATRFTDVDGSHRHAAFIERFAESGVTQGCDDGTAFCPDDTVTRAQMAVFLSRAFDLAEGPDPGFSDVPANAWYAAEVAKLAASGITLGCGDGTRFCPDKDTTRAQMATFLHRALERDSQPPPTGAIEPLPQDWLDRLNAYRAASGLAPVVENRDWVASIELHLNYLNVEGPYGDPSIASSHHNEDPDSPHYTVEGHTAGRSSNLSNGHRTDADAIDGWMRAPYHARHMLHPRLGDGRAGQSTDRRRPIPPRIGCRPRARRVSL